MTSGPPPSTPPACASCAGTSTSWALTAAFTIYDTDDSQRVVKDILKDLSLDEKPFPPASCWAIISRAKDAMKLAEEYLAARRKGWGLAPDKHRQGVCAYKRQLREANALDFDDIILHTVRLLQEDGRRGPTTSGSSAMCSSTSIRTPTICSICWPSMLAGGYREHLRGRRRRPVHLPLPGRHHREHPLL